MDYNSFNQDLFKNMNSILNGMNSLILKSLLEKGITKISIIDLETCGFKINEMINKNGNQNPGSIRGELPYYSKFHVEGATITKDEYSSLYSPVYIIQVNYLNAATAQLENKIFELKNLINMYENTAFAFRNEFDDKKTASNYEKLAEELKDELIKINP